MKYREAIDDPGIEASPYYLVTFNKAEGGRVTAGRVRLALRQGGELKVAHPPMSEKEMNSRERAAKSFRLKWISRTNDHSRNSSPGGDRSLILDRREMQVLEFVLSNMNPENRPKLEEVEEPSSCLEFQKYIDSTSIPTPASI